MLTAEEVERRFLEAENARTELYERSRRQQQLDFALTAAPWSKTEDARVEVFQRFLIDTLETFTKHQEQRLVEFKEVMDRHDDVFRANDAKRQTAFDEAGESQFKTFLATQEKREKAIVKFARYQEELYEKERKERDAERARLVALFREMFERAVREQRASFSDAQQQREVRIQIILVSSVLIFRRSYTEKRLYSRKGLSR